jgi:DNA mismatch repair protein MutS2
VPGNSYAFDLARNVGLPDIVLTRGQGYLGERHDELEKSISAMQRFKLEAEQLKLTAAQELLKAERVRKDYEERLSQVKEKRANVVENAREEAKEILSKANALIENTIRDIVEKEKSAKQAKEDFEKAKSSLLTASSEQRVSGTSHESARDDSTSRFSVGDDVTIVGTSNAGTIITIDDKYEYATIDVNGIKFRTLISQLTSSKPSRATSNERRTLSTESYIAPATDAGRRTMDEARPTMSLDMRGMRADEGLRALEVFLDNAVLKNHPFVSIIHGKGTGALRKVVHDYLADHHAIESFRLGEIHEGGDGVTIVSF